jgi:hypothetical protein
MPQTLEYPYNGITVLPPLPAGDVGTFLDANIRDIHRVRVLLDPRVVAPLGTSTDAPLTVTIDGIQMSAEQSVNARAIIGVANTKVHAQLTTTAKRRRAAVMSLACAIVESRLWVYANSTVPNSTATGVYYERIGSNGFSVGLFQQQVGSGFQYSNSLADVTYVMNRENSASLFLDRLLAVTNWDTADAGLVIQDAQDSGAGVDALYNAQMAKAEEIVTAVGFPPPGAAAITIPTAVQSALVEIANGCQQAAAGSFGGTNVQIEWALNTALWPTSATAGRRPRVADLVDFWNAMRSVVGGHAATWGFSLLNNPTFAETAAANADPHASMTAYANTTWTGGTSPSTTDHQTACRWLETLTSQVVSALRAAGFAKKIAVPTMYAPGHLKDIALFHPNGPWINDANVWYETSFFPAALDETQVKSSYATYNTWAAGLSATYRASWSESAYFTQASGSTSVIDPETLASPPQEALPPDPNAAPAVPPTAPVLTAVEEGDSAIRAVWSAPTSGGTSPITGYRLTLTWVDGNTSVETLDPLATSRTITGLENDVDYLVAVQAISAAGSSPLSNTITGTPTEGGPPLEGEEEQPPEGEQPPVIIPAPNIFAFYPTGSGTLSGVFSPDNWAGL